MRPARSTSILACGLSFIAACGGATSEIRSGEAKQTPAPVRASPAPEVLSLERIGRRYTRMLDEVLAGRGRCGA